MFTHFSLQDIEGLNLAKFFRFMAYCPHFCRLVDLQTQTREPTSESIPTNCEPLRTLLIVSLVLVVVGFLTTLVVIFILRRKAYRRQNIGELKKILSYKSDVLDKPTRHLNQFVQYDFKKYIIYFKFGERMRCCMDSS